jgi:hypothetical protein
VRAGDELMDMLGFLEPTKYHILFVGGLFSRRYGQEVPLPPDNAPKCVRYLGRLSAPPTPTGLELPPAPFPTINLVPSFKSLTLTP